MKPSLLQISSIAVIATALPSCTTVNPFTGENQISKAARGASIGALGGALAGVLIGDDTKATLTGAVAGAAVGGGIGYYMDTQEAEVRRQLQGTGVSVTRAGDELILNMPSDITFNSGSSALKAEFSSTLQSVSLVLNKYTKTNISITGHTDSDGSTGSNQTLSVSRAQAVAQDLNSRRVSGERLLTQGAGESSPIASNSTVAGKAANRRVELRIVPKGNQF